jgi:phosphohistidine phosphatase SixA
MSQTLYLLRHCEAEPWSPMGNDFARPLSANGHKHANLLSGWMKENLATPDTILCSPAKRTRQTLAPVLSLWHQCLSTTDYVDSMYGASTDLLLTLAKDTFSYSDRVLMVAHNPGIENLLGRLVQNEWPSGIGHFAAGTLAVIQFPAGCREGSSQTELLHLVSRKALSVD